MLHGHLRENDKDKRTKISSRSKKFNVRAPDVDATSTQAHLSRDDLTMKLAILSLAVVSAAAFTTSGSSRASTKLNGAMEDLKAVAEKSNPVLKVRVFFYIPRIYVDKNVSSPPLFSCSTTIHCSWLQLPSMGNLTTQRLLFYVMPRSSTGVLQWLLLSDTLSKPTAFISPGP